MTVGTVPPSIGEILRPSGPQNDVSREFEGPCDFCHVLRVSVPTLTNEGVFYHNSGSRSSSPFPDDSPSAVSIRRWRNSTKWSTSSCFSVGRRSSAAWICSFVFGTAVYTSMVAYLALRSMNLRRGSTESPMSVEKMRSAAAASSMPTCCTFRVSGFIVVVHSCSGFISPRPL